MTEVELIEAIDATLGGRKKSAVSLVIRTMKVHMEKALKSGESVVLTDFGTFTVKKFKKKPLFGKPREDGFWTKVKFSPSRRRHHGEVRSGSGRREDEDSGTGP